MNEVNKTLYIPLYGKATVSRKGIILKDTKAEEIWEKEQFYLKGKAKSKWLAYYMAMRARVFDDWVCEKLIQKSVQLVLHIGCGMDSRLLRAGKNAKNWIDVDFLQVICERKKYYTENNNYKMLGADASNTDWISELPDSTNAIVILECVSMYLTNKQVSSLFSALNVKYDSLNILMDVYTEFGAKASKYKNPINNVGVNTVYGINSPQTVLSDDGIVFLKEHSMTPKRLVGELKGIDKAFFKMMFAGKLAGKVYRLFEYGTNK